MIRLSSAQSSEADKQAWERWHGQGEEQRRAWQLAKSVTGTFERVPQGLDTAAVVGKVDPSRRRALNTLAALVGIPTVGWGLSEISFGEWVAQYRTSKGEQQSLVLADGTKVVLNTASAIDVNFDPVRRLIRLWAGEVMVMPEIDNTGSNRPLVLSTGQGSVRSLGRKFSAHIRNSTTTDVCALDGRLEIRPRSAQERPYVLDTGRRVAFERGEVMSEVAIEPNTDLWTEGLLFAANMRLSDLVAELSRYRRGLIRCDSAVADLRVSGMFQLKSIDKVLALLEKSYPISVRQVVPGWVVVEAR